MSYGIDVIDSEVPESYDLAVARVNEAREARDANLAPELGSQFEEPSAKMSEFHRRLTARFPCITQDPDGPWSDGPLINNFGQRSASLGLSFSRVGEVLPFVIATATEMGFWVFDPQDQAAHTTRGTALRAKSWWRFWR